VGLVANFGSAILVAVTVGAPCNGPKPHDGTCSGQLPGPVDRMTERPTDKWFVFPNRMVGQCSTT
jgi:hypothetical protein